jgi:hypothetical protein
MDTTTTTPFARGSSRDRRTLAVSLVLGCLVAGASAGQETAAEPAAGAGMSAPTARIARHDAGSDSSATVIGSLPPGVRGKLERGWFVAHRHLEEHASCRALFTDLGADGYERLHHTIYLGRPRGSDRRSCPRRVAAHTSLHRPYTQLCPDFARLSDNWAGIVLLHEALHFAGLPESPAVPGALTSSDINQLVIDRCGF